MVDISHLAIVTNTSACLKIEMPTSTILCKFSLSSLSAFREHYFSHTNIGRSGAIRALMASQNSVPLEKVVMASRLASVNVTESELSAVIRTYSDDLDIVTDSHGRSSVKRRDNCEYYRYLNA